MTHAHTPSRSEPFFWSLFSAGGVIAAFFMPVLILLFGILGPLGVLPASALSRDRLLSYLMAMPLHLHLALRGFLFALVLLSLFHWAHRFRFAVYDLGFKAARGAVAVACYGSALAGSVWAAKTLLALG